MVTAKEIMSTKYLAVKADTPVRDLAASLAEPRFYGAPVIDDDGKLIGVVTESDLIYQHKNLHLPTVFTLFDSVITFGGLHEVEDQIKKMLGSAVADIMSTDVTTVEEGATLEEIATIMSEQHKHFIPVIRDDVLVGVIDRTSLLKAIIR
ncbi:hypothetical protein MNBD_NITROSPINAE02-618 [hydrothermal vent metagenome]|uniref:CBS domain-containing protein n=1 Tax=hydrothermal vent metagenome TaxID=652676 RepID=A0A3B1BTQ7_9ZZZZ